MSQQPTGHEGGQGVRFCNPGTQHGPWHRPCTNTTDALKRIAADNPIQVRREGRTDCTCCIREPDNRGQPVTGALWLLNLSAAPHSPGAGTWPQEHQPRKESYPDESRDWRCHQITPVTESIETCFVTRTPTGGPRQNGVGKVSRLQKPPQFLYLGRLAAALGSLCSWVDTAVHVDSGRLTGDPRAPRPGLPGHALSPSSLQTQATPSQLLTFLSSPTHGALGPLPREAWE